MCETLYSTTSELTLVASSIVWGKKNLIIEDGRVVLKSSNATQHLAAVDHGAIYLFPSCSNTCAPSGFKAGGSVIIALRSALFCSSQPVGDVTAI